MKTGFRKLSQDCGQYGVFDIRFGIYVKSYVYRDVFVIIIDFYGELGTKYCFGRNPVFAVREQHVTVRKKLSPQSGWKCSKVPLITWNLVYF